MEMTYVVSPKLGLPSRLILGLGLAAAGIAVQFLLPSPGWILGCFLVLGGGLLFSAKGITNKPADIGLEEWRPVTTVELDRIADKLRSSTKVRLPLLLSRGGAMLVTIACAVLALFFGLGSSALGIAMVDALLLVAIPLFSGSIQVWIPKELKMKMECMQAVLSCDLPEGVTITPYLRFDKDKAGKEIPEDVRLMVESRGKREDVVGVQLQAAINNGENGAVPYLYAVALTKGGGPSFGKLSGMKVEGYEVEFKEPEEYGAVVVRQDTGAGGYKTSVQDCKRLFALCLKILDAVKA
jgi:hypothetical protein